MPRGWSGATPVNVVDANAYELGTEQRANQDVTLTGIWVWSDGQNVGGRQARIWNPSSGQVVQTIDLPAQLPAGWSLYALTIPIPRTAGQRWIVAFHTGGGYGTVPNALNADVVSADGNVTTLATLNATNGNGVFRTTPGQFPNQNFGATFYGIDVEYEPGLGDASAPVISGVEVDTEGLAVVATVAATDAEGDTLTYTIEWGDGTTSSGPATQAHHYAASGTYALLARVADPGGLTDYAAVVVAVEDFPEPTSDPVVMPLARALLECYQDELAKLEDPPKYVQLRAGNVVSHLLSTFQDECCEGLAWVRPASFFPSSSTFPGQDAAPMKGGTRAWAVTLELGFVRCAPVGDENTIPTGEEWDATVQAVMDGAAAMRRALCCFEEGRRQVLPGIWQPIEVQGGCVGGLMTLTVRGPACDCSEAGAS